MKIKGLDVYFCLLFLFFAIGAFEIPAAGIIALLLWCIWGVFIVRAGGIRVLLSKCLTDMTFWLFALFISCFGILCIWENNRLLATKNFANYFLMFTPWMIYRYYSASGREGQAISLKKGIENVYFFWYALACIYFIIYPDAVVQMARGSYNRTIIALGGGQWLAYGACLHCVYLVYGFLNKKRSTKDLFLIFAASLLVWLSQSTITLLLLLFGIGLCLIDYGIKMATKKILWFMMCGCLVGIIMMIVFCYKDIINILFQMSQSWQLTNADKILIRVRHIISILYGEAQEQSISLFLRIGTYRQSGVIFRENILFGIGIEEGVLLSNGSLGGHSEILDALANWGIIIGGSYLCSYFKTLFKRRHKGMFLVGVTVLIMGCLNPIISFQVTAMILLFIPISDNIDKKGLENGLLCT